MMKSNLLSGSYTTVPAVAATVTVTPKEDDTAATKANSETPLKESITITHGNVDDDMTEEPTKLEIRGAGIGAGVVGLAVGGPILAIVAGIVAAQVAKKSNGGPGRFCRRCGRWVANVVVKGCDWVKKSVGSDGTETVAAGAAAKVVPADAVVDETGTEKLQIY